MNGQNNGARSVSGASNPDPIMGVAEDDHREGEQRQEKSSDSQAGAQGDAKSEPLSFRQVDDADQQNYADRGRGGELGGARGAPVA